MPARITIERILRDDDDASGQSIRDWTIEVDGDLFKIKLKHGDGFVLLREADIDLFTSDLECARDAKRSILTDGQEP